MTRITGESRQTLDERSNSFTREPSLPNAVAGNLTPVMTKEGVIIHVVVPHRQEAIVTPTETGILPTSVQHESDGDSTYQQSINSTVTEDEQEMVTEESFSEAADKQSSSNSENDHTQTELVSMDTILTDNSEQHDSAIESEGNCLNSSNLFREYRLGGLKKSDFTSGEAWHRYRRIYFDLKNQLYVTRRNLVKIKARRKKFNKVIQELKKKNSLKLRSIWRYIFCVRFILP